MGRSQAKRSKKIQTTRAKTKSAKSLIPLGDKYMKNGFNLLLIGPHGTGKTETVMQIAQEAGMKLKIFNCATLDPYIDLIGVPVPEKDGDGDSELHMVRSSVLEDTEVIFFDEINRAPLATRNAVFEIIQFQSINGEKLPKLKCCWAAMNPADGEYEVEDIDPALIDRFDAYRQFNPKVSVQYMSQQMKKSTAQALQAWWQDHNRAKRGSKSYISPRKLTKLGILYETIGSSAVRQALPPGGKYDSKKLIELLNAADNGTLGKATKKAAKKKAGIKSQAPIDDSLKNKTKLLADKDRVLKHLKNDPKDINTQTKIVNILKKGVGTEKLFLDYIDVINNLSENQIESLFSSMSDAKKYQVRNIVWDIQTGRAKYKQIQLGRYKNLKKILEKLRFTY